MSILTYKTCRTCGKLKKIDEYYKNERMADGHFTECILCCRERNKRNYQKNKEIVNERARCWAQDNPEKAKEAAKRYQVSEKNKKRRRKKYYENVEQSRKYFRDWGRKNRDKTVAWARRWRRNNKERNRINKKRRYARERGAEGDYTFEQWELLVLYYSPDNTCLSCGKKKKLTVDHVVPLVNGGTNYISNLQPLCRRCNSSKRDKGTDYRPDKGEYARQLEEV